MTNIDWRKGVASLVAIGAAVGMVIVAYIFGAWLWSLVLEAEAAEWYGLRDTFLNWPLGILVVFGIYFGGVALLLVLPVLVGSWVYSGAYEALRSDPNDADV